MSKPAKNDPPEDESPPKRPRGAPAGSQNAARHYLRAGKLPKSLAYIECRINAFRRHLEAAVTQAKGEVSIVDAACISSACKWERHGVLAQHWLRKEGDSLSTSDKLKFSEAIAKASDQRDRNLRLLQLDAKVDVFAAVNVKTKVTDVEEEE